MRRLSGILLLVTLACGSGDESSSNDASPTEADASDEACTHIGFADDNQAAERDDELGVLFFTATSGEFPTLQRLTFDFYFPFGATDGPQEITFDGENLRDCHTCLVARRDCDSASCASGKAFLVQSGTASIAAMGAVGTSFQGTISDAVFAEVTISPADLETTLVPNGERWCIDSLGIEASISAP